MTEIKEEGTFTKVKMHGLLDQYTIMTSNSKETGPVNHSGVPVYSII